MITIDDHRVCYDGITEPHAHFFCKRCEKFSILKLWRCHATQVRLAKVSELTTLNFTTKEFVLSALKR